MIHLPRALIVILFAIGFVNSATTVPSPRAAAPTRNLAMLSTHRASLARATSPRGMKLTLEMSNQAASFSTSRNGARLSIGIVGFQQAPPGRAAAENWTEY